MIQSGKNFDNINEKIAILKTLTKQSGEQGLLNIHNHCENFIRNLLNLTYGHRLDNLNHTRVNFPGLDLGDKIDGIAYQITAEKSSEKVNDMLTKVIRHKHYTFFSKIKVFMLLGKQGSYNIKVTTLPHFNFSPAEDIVDFDDLLKDIKDADPAILSSLNEFINREFPITENAFRNNSERTNTRILIDVNEGLQVSKLKFYKHWACHLELHGRTFTVPAIYRAFEELINDNLTAKTLLRIFNDTFYLGANSKAATFKRKLSSDGVVNNFKEGILLIEGNNIKVEHAHYNSSEDFVSQLNEEIGSILILLFVCHNLNKKGAFQAELSIDLSTNGKLHFSTQQSIYSVEQCMVDYVLNPTKLEFSAMAYDITNDTFIEVMEQIIHGFSAEHDYFGVKKPFLEIHRYEQEMALNTIKDRIFPPHF